MDLIASLIVIVAFGTLLYLLVRLPSFVFLPIVRSRLWDIRDRAWDLSWRGEIPAESATRLIDTVENMIRTMSVAPGFLLREIVDPRSLTTSAATSSEQELAGETYTYASLLRVALTLDLLSDALWTVARAGVVSSWSSILFWAPPRRGHLAELRSDAARARKFAKEVRTGSVYGSLSDAVKASPKAEPKPSDWRFEKLTATIGPEFVSFTNADVDRVLGEFECIRRNSDESGSLVDRDSEDISHYV